MKGVVGLCQQITSVIASRYHSLGTKIISSVAMAILDQGCYRQWVEGGRSPLPIDLGTL